MNAANQGLASVRNQGDPGTGWSQSGVALEADTGQLLSSETLLTRLTGQVGDLLGRGFELSLRLSSCGGAIGASQLVQLTSRLSAALDAPGRHMASLVINLPAGRVPPDVAWQVCNEVLGIGRLNMVCDDAGSVDEAFWLRLWRLRRESRVDVALWPVLRGPSSLLPSEQARNVEPSLGLQVPTQSAWMSAPLWVPSVLDANGSLCEHKLQTLLADTLHRLDAAHDNAHWPTSAMRQDAWLNRRLAIRAEGIGDAVAMFGLDPREVSTQRRCLKILREIRYALRAATRRMARDGCLLPAIDASNPVRGIASGPVRDRWEHHWQKAVKRGGVRHRNLLALSPWAVFAGDTALPAYFGLLALLGEADCCVVGRRPPITEWNAKEFKHFYQSLWAVRRRVEAKTLVAERL